MAIESRHRGLGGRWECESGGSSGDAALPPAAAHARSLHQLTVAAPEPASVGQADGPKPPIRP